MANTMTGIDQLRLGSYQAEDVIFRAGVGTGSTAYAQGVIDHGVQ